MADASQTGGALEGASRLSPLYSEGGDSSRLLQQALTWVPFGVALLDDQMRLRWVNDVFLTFLKEQHRGVPLGLDLEDALEETFSGLAPLAADALDQGSPCAAGEWEHGPPQGTVFWRWLFLPLDIPGLEYTPAEGGGAGEAGGLLAVAVDITDQVAMRRRSEDLAERSQQRAAELSATFRALVEAVVILDADGRAVYQNPAAARFLGGDPFARPAGDPLADLRPRREDGHPIDRADMPGSRALHGEVVEREKIYLSTAAVGEVVALISAGPIELDGRLRGAVIVAQDVTDHEMLLREREEARRLAQALNDIHVTLSSTLDHEEIMRRLVVEAAQALRSDSSALDLLEEGVWRVRYGYRIPSEMHGRHFSTEEAPFAIEAAHSQRVVAVEDAYADARANEEIQRRFGIQAVLVAPVVVREECVALIFFNYHAGPRRFTEGERAFAQELADTAGTILENAGLYRAERDLARTLQSALLTVAPGLPGLAYGHLHRSATVGAEIGGDFYDLFPLVRDRVGVLIGDVSGKGVESSALASLAKNGMKAYLHEGVTPAEVLSKTNLLLLGHAPRAIFVTAFLGVLDLHTGVLTYSSAGHPPSLVRRRDARVEELDSGSLIMGLFEDTDYTDARTVLAPDEILLLYTDGLIEARRGEEFFGEERLAEIMRRKDLPSCPEVPQLLLEETMRFTDGRLIDDLAVFSVSRLEDWAPGA